MNPEVDSLAVLGSVIEELMDVTPVGDVDALNDWKARRQRLVDTLERNGFRYYLQRQKSVIGEKNTLRSIVITSQRP
jgi:hypothetical protein